MVYLIYLSQNNVKIQKSSEYATLKWKFHSPMKTTFSKVLPRFNHTYIHLTVAHSKTALNRLTLMVPLGRWPA